MKYFDSHAHYYDERFSEELTKGVDTFIGTLLSLAIFKTLPHYTYFIALGLMIVGGWLASSDKPINIFKKKM